MNYEDAIARIESLNKFGMKIGLERIEKLLNLLGNPQDKIKFIHIAGTNGKGSTAKMLSSVLIDSGYRTGLFISPHVIDFCERIQINNNMISKNEISNLLEDIMPEVDAMAEHGDIITEFELITAMAFKYFADKDCDVVVLEVGLGGRGDSTNIISNPLLEVITSISYDHTNILGGTLEKIAFEKCGIIKDNTDVVVYPDQDENVMDVIKDVCKSKHSRLILADDSSIKIISEDINCTYVEYEGIKIRLPLSGRHQVKNLSVVLSAIDILVKKGFNISIDNIKAGIENTKFAARIEILNKNPIVILDGSHNPSGISSLCEFIKLHVKCSKIIGIVGMLGDKDIDSSLANIKDLFSSIITVPINNSRALKSKEMESIVKKYCDDVYSEDSIKKAVDHACKLSGDGGAIIIFGSLYLASEMRNIVIKKFDIK